MVDSTGDEALGKNRHSMIAATVSKRPPVGSVLEKELVVYCLLFLLGAILVDMSNMVDLHALACYIWK